MTTTPFAEEERARLGVCGVVILYDRIEPATVPLLAREAEAAVADL